MILLAATSSGLYGCGSKFTGTYALTQSGGIINSQQCSQINLTMNESSSQLQGYGSNNCISEQISGTTTSGQANVTVTIQQGMTGGYNNNAYNNNGYNNGYNTGYNNGYNYNGYNGYSNGGGVACVYQGQLTISGNVVQGVLMPTGSNSCGGQLTVNGTKN